MQVTYFFYKTLMSIILMNHNERMQIAEYFTKKMMQKYRKDILVGGIFGSTSRNEDTKYSDLEMIFIVKDSSKAKTTEFFYKGILISLDVEKISDVRKTIENVTILWSLQMQRLVNFKVTCGNAKILRKFRERIKKIPDKTFKDAISKELPCLVDTINKMKTNRFLNINKETIDVSREILYGINLAIGLLNKKYFTRNYYKNFVEAYSFQKLPIKYKKLVEEIWLCKNANRVIKLCSELMNNYVDLLKSNRIELPVAKSLDSIVV